MNQNGSWTQRGRHFLAPMRRALMLLVACCALTGATGCSSGSARSDREAAEELRRMAAEDQAARTPPRDPDPAEDAKRQRRVLELLVDGRIRDAESREHASLILQHAGLAIRDSTVVAVSLDDFLLAHLLAKAAVAQGRESARGFAAVALDRYLVFSGKPQHYGTQTLYDPRKGKSFVPPIDPATTDAERALWHVEPLAQFLAHQRH